MKQVSQLLRCVWLSELLMFLLFHFASPVTGYEAKANCDEFARNIAQYTSTDSITLNNREIDGVWTSSSCETYNGPQFVLRKYIIGQDGKWYAEHHHFKDGWCSQPTFTLTIKGIYKIGARNNLGGHNGEFHARSFLLVPHEDSELLELSKVVQQHCPKAGLSEIRQDDNGKVVLPSKKNFTLTKDAYRQAKCRERLGIHIYTLKRLRLFRDRKTSNVNDQLYFGETPTHHSRRSYIPSAYQYSLKRANSNCGVCRKLGSASVGQAVRLAKKSWTKGIAEEWTSISCQAMAHTFMSRYLKFSSPDKQGRRSWRLVYYFFLDSSCKVLSYKIAAEGTYSKPVRSRKLPGAYEVAFNLTNTEITPYEMLIVGSLKSEPEGTCGVSAQWRSGQMQSVRSTKGCRLFGIKIPSLEFDVLKTVRRDDGEVDLFTGQSSTINIIHNTPEKRPTSFQLPLRRCRDMTKGIKSVPTTKAARTRKILIQVPEFTLPKRYLVTEAKRQNKDREVKDRAAKKSRYDNSNSATSCNPSKFTLTAVLIILKLFQCVS